jgi:hypothetical protein
MSDVLSKIGDGLWNSVLMAYEVWWALVLGFAISAIVQAWFPREKVENALRRRVGPFVAAYRREARSLTPGRPRQNGYPLSSKAEAGRTAPRASTASLQRPDGRFSVGRPHTNSGAWDG